MSHVHAGHNHSHIPQQGGNERLLLIALALTSTFLVVEVIAGFVFNSLALLSDAAHMFTDAAALAIAVAAVRIGKHPADDRRTFGYRRFEILAAAFNAVLLFGVAIYIAVEGIRRLITPEPVQSMGMLIVAALGLAINLIAMRLLSSGKERSLNVKGAYLEVWADMLGSLGVIVGAIVIQLTGQRWVDPIVAIAIGFWVLPRTWTLLRDSTSILLESAPRGIVLGDVRKSIRDVAGVSGIHDLHVWVMGADQPSCSVHVEVNPGEDAEAVRLQVAVRLREAFDIAHTTIQMESVACDDEHVHR